MDKNLIVAIVLTAIIAGGGGYYAGKSVQTSVSQAGSTFSDRAGGNNGGRGGRNNNGGFVSGKILSKDATGISVQLRGGQGGQANQTGSKIVFMSSSTQVMKAVQGSTLDLNVGEDVTVMGTPNSDGSVTAENIQIRPQTEGPPTSAPSK